MKTMGALQEVLSYALIASFTSWTLIVSSIAESIPIFVCIEADVSKNRKERAETLSHELRSVQPR
jgi:hypothetical protein